MRLEDQVCNLELSIRLRELGVKQESLFYWEVHYSVPSVIYMPSRNTNDAHVSAFTVSELGQIIGHDYFTVKTGAGNWQCFKLDVIRCMEGGPRAHAQMRGGLYHFEVH